MAVDQTTPKVGTILTGSEGRDAIHFALAPMKAIENVKPGQEEKVFEKTKDQVLNVLRQTLRPEFYNRVDEIIMFTPLDRKHLEGIVKIQLGYLFDKLKDQQIHLSLTDEAMQFIIERGYDPAMGARPVKRVIQKEVLNALSKAILGNRVKKDEPIVMDVFDGQVVFRAPLENEKLIQF